MVEYEAYIPGTDSVELLVWFLLCPPAPSFYRYKRQIRTCSGHNNDEEHSLVKPPLQHHWACTPSSVLAQHPQVCDALGLTLCLSGRWELRQEWKEVDFIGLGTWSRQSWNYTGGNLLLAFSKHLTYSVYAMCTWCDIIGYVLNVFMCCRESKPFLLSFIGSENGIWELSWGSHAAALW